MHFMKPMCWLPDLKYLIEKELFINCRLFTTDRFISHCRDLGIDTSSDQLEQFEKLGIFYPFARVSYPEKMNGFVDVWSQKELALEWLREGQIWEPSSREFQKW
jgi:hypothetical protein